MLLPAFNAPVTLMLPVVLVMVTLLVIAALSVMPVIASDAVLSFKLTLLLAVLVAAKLVTTLVAVSSNVPELELVVSVAPVTMPLLFCVI